MWILQCIECDLLHLMPILSFPDPLFFRYHWHNFKSPNTFRVDSKKEWDKIIYQSQFSDGIPLIDALLWDTLK